MLDYTSRTEVHLRAGGAIVVSLSDLIVVGGVAVESERMHSRKADAVDLDRFSSRGQELERRSELVLTFLHGVGPFL